MFFSFLIGSCWFSFIATHAWRKINSVNTFKRRSVCDVCQHILTWWQLIPIIGFLVQRGKCWHCDSKIPYFWPVGELITGLFCMTLYPDNIKELLAIILAVTTAIVVVVQDYCCQEFYFPFLIGLLPAIIIFHHPVNFLQFGFLILLYFLPGLGSGDVDIIIIIFILFNWYFTCLVILLSCMLILTNRRIYQHQHVAFLPYIATAVVIIRGTLLLNLHRDLLLLLF